MDDIYPEDDQTQSSVSNSGSSNDSGSAFFFAWCSIMCFVVFGVSAITSIYDYLNYDENKLDTYNCFVKNFSYTDYNETYSTKLTFEATINEINLTNNLNQYFKKPRDYTFLISNKNHTELYEKLNTTISKYLYKNITCYTDKINIYLNDNEYKYPDLKIFLIIMAILFLICFCISVICMCLN